MQNDHSESLVELMVREGRGSSSPLYSFLRSSETRFLLTVLEGEVGDWSLVGDIGGNGSPLGGEEDFASSCGSLGVVTDIVIRKGRRDAGGWAGGIGTKKRVGRLRYLGFIYFPAKCPCRERT